VNYDEKQLSGKKIWVVPSICTGFVNTCPKVFLSHVFVIPDCIMKRLLCEVKGKCKAIPLQALTDPGFPESWGSQILRQSAHESGKIVSSTHRPPIPPGKFLVLISVRDWINPRAIVRSEGICQRKIPMTPSVIDPATFRFVVPGIISGGAKAAGA
jgi:hypothetical protein